MLLCRRSSVKPSSVIRLPERSGKLFFYSLGPLRSFDWEIRRSTLCVACATSSMSLQTFHRRYVSRSRARTCTTHTTRNTQYTHNPPKGLMGGRGLTSIARTHFGCETHTHTHNPNQNNTRVQHTVSHAHIFCLCAWFCRSSLFFLSLLCCNLLFIDLNMICAFFVSAIGSGAAYPEGQGCG